MGGGIVGGGVVGGMLVSFADSRHVAGRPRYTLQNEGLGQITGPVRDKLRCDLRTQRIPDSHYTTEAQRPSL